MGFIGHEITVIHPFNPFETSELGNPSYGSGSNNNNNFAAGPAFKKQCVPLRSLHVQSPRGISLLEL